MLKKDNFNKKMDRQSNLELYRIIFMYLIVLHHYVVNSGLIDSMQLHGDFMKNLFYAIVGGWGKLGINCFVLITGYFMCKSDISAIKFIKLLAEVLFYNLTIFLIFVLSGYQSFGIIPFIKCVFPFYNISDGFTSCYLLFYLLIPYLNMVIKQLSKKQYIHFLCIILSIYVLIPSIPKMSITFNYVTWFCVIYFIGAFIRVYENEIVFLKKYIGIKCFFCFFIAICSIIVGTYCSSEINSRYWYFVTDSNKLLAVLPAVFAFLWFKNLNIRYSKLINMVAASTFGVLMIHANSDTMRQWLWKDVLHNAQIYESNYFVLHIFLSTLVIFVFCTVIDMIRIRVLEKPFMKWISGFGDSLFVHREK